MKITDGIKLAIGIWIGNSVMKTINNGFMKYVLNNEFENDFMKAIKDLFEDETKSKQKKVNYTKVKVKGFRAD